MEHEILNAALQPGPDCIDVERLGRFVDGAVEPDERRAIAAHVDGCATCQAEITLLQAFTDGSVDATESAAVRDIVAELRRRPSPIPAATVHESRTWRGIPLGMLRAIVTTVALLVVASSVYLFRSTAPQLPTDIDAGRDVTRSLAIAVVSPLGDQRSVPSRLEWRPVAGASRYHVRLMEVDRTELWSVDTDASAVELPEAMRARIVPAKTLLWDVTAFASSSAVIATSDAQRFRVVP
jgi:hypothetical protein